MTALWTLIGGPDADQVALLLERDAGGGVWIPWFGDWRGDAPARRSPRGPQRWGARLGTPPPSLLLPGAGGAWTDAPGLEFERSDGRWTFLPSETTVVQLADSPATGMRVCQSDPASEVRLETCFHLDPETGVLRMESVVTNLGSDVLTLFWCASVMLPVPFWADHMLDHGGDWCGEFQREIRPLGEAGLIRESRSGRSSHGRFPGTILAEGLPRSDAGRLFGAQLAWSGDHRGRVDTLDDGSRMLQLGVLPAAGECRLEPGAAWQTPAAYVAVTRHGLDALARCFTEGCRRQVLPASGGRWPRPVHLNTWEAMYFDHDPARLAALIEAAAAVGVERFVLDDGWFRGRSSDRGGLGDWSPDPERYPDGLGPLAEQVVAHGLEFGLWVEPEMVSEDSDLFRSHPEWVRGLPDRAPIIGRNQRVLDLSRPAVVEHLFEVLSGLLRSHPIGYLKWDHNRVLTEAAADGRAGHMAQVEALYGLLRRLRAAHPEVEIESCASGGGRLDWGMLGHCHRVWTSDSNDPVVRARIMAGAGLFLPPEVLGVHVGPERAHTTGRRTGLDFRAAVALLGHFGLELDLLALTDVERQRLAGHVARYRRLRGLLHSGHHATPVFDEDHLVRVVTAGDRSSAVLIVLRLDDRRPGRPVRFRLADLDARRDYRVVLADPLPESGLADRRAWLPPGAVVSGAWLAHGGLSLQLPAPQSAAVFEIAALE